MNFDTIKNKDRVKDPIQACARELQRKAWQASDLIVERDGKTLQYVDLVMEGGGTLGVALIGYIYALEQLGLRFLSIGGTSAGAITALMLVAARPAPDGTKAGALASILFNLNIADFIDGDNDARDFSRFIGNGDAQKKPAKAIWLGAQVIDNIQADLGLNPGDEFLKWLQNQLREQGVQTLAEMNQRMRDTVPADLRHREKGEIQVRDVSCELGIIAADITTETKVQFPKMAPLYWKNPQEMSPAYFARASMSIPFFFHPLRCKGVNKLSNAAKNWKELAGYTGELPAEVLFADGGVMSNFPIDMFHVHDSIPAAPTFGVKLGKNSRTVKKISGPVNYVAALFDSMRHYADFDFVAKNPDYRYLIGYIDTGDHNWLNFSMSDNEKADLFFRGVECACKFVLSFDWQEYKKTRAALRKVAR